MQKEYATLVALYGFDSLQKEPVQSLFLILHKRTDSLESFENWIKLFAPFVVEWMQKRIDSFILK